MMVVIYYSFCPAPFLWYPSAKHHPTSCCSSFPREKFFSRATCITAIFIRVQVYLTIEKQAIPEGKQRPASRALFYVFNGAYLRR